MKNIFGIYFSPTGNTKKAIDKLVESQEQINFTPFDITLKKDRDEIHQTIQHQDCIPDLWIIGCPVYSGAIPKLVSETIIRLNGANIPTIALVSYGNKDYGSSIKQLTDVLSQQNFRVISVGAFIGEHSYSDKFGVAIGRPDKSDFLKISDFGKLLPPLPSYSTSEDWKNKKVDFVSKLLAGDKPKPDVDLEKCNNCGICTENCPVEALSPENKQFKDEKSKKECIGCVACVRKCPKQARSYSIPRPIHFFLNKYYFKTARDIRNEPFLINV